MRFDDMLATVLARQPDRLNARVSQWRQILDLLAQRRLGADPTVGHDAFARLDDLRADVPLTIRRETARTLAGRPVPLRLVAFLAGDVPQVAGEILGHVTLSDQEWLLILPRLSPTGRGILRHRRDLPHPVMAALAVFGSSDFALGVVPGLRLASIAPLPVSEPEPVAETMIPPEIVEAPTPEPELVFADEPEAIVVHEPAKEPETVTAPPFELEPEIDDVAVAEIPVVAATEPEFEAAPELAYEPEPELSFAPEASSEPAPEPIFADIAPPADILSGPYEPSAGEGQIRAIITRIARFRNGQGAASHPQGQHAEEHDLFRFEAGPDGIIRWIEGVPRGAIVGETIATPAIGDYGVDAQAPGAFRRRSAFRDARLVVAGIGVAGGEWRIAGVPVFAPADGRFLGYRGTGRRPRSDERAEAKGVAIIAAPAATPEAAAIGGLTPDSLRQLVHELRTPLNAIGGFAEMIRRQMRGPVSEGYRERAQRIAEQASQLLAAVDDLDVAARLDGAQLDLQRVPVDVALLLSAVCADHADLARARGSAIERYVAADLPSAIGDAATMRRMIARLISSSTALADSGETIHVELTSADDQLALVVARPRRLAGVSEAELLDPGYGPDGDWPAAPLLGLGFSLHLVRRLAAAAEGALLIDDESFTLRLPTAEASTSAADLDL